MLRYLRKGAFSTDRYVRSSGENDRIGLISQLPPLTFVDHDLDLLAKDL